MSGYSNLKKDVSKLCTALDKAKSIKWAQIAYFMECGSSTTATAENRVNVYTDRIDRQASEHISKLGKKVTLHRSKVRVEDDWAWTAAVLEIVRH
ncbi:MAG: hypothetical protein F4X44_10270 [Gammaproteobacteria bacterium]|nr:hypothetical protein [Gammaproteobacteria bacterium]MYD80983.1 hypothetical protein [Gammaproteobacteria bacterium]